MVRSGANVPDEAYDNEFARIAGEVLVAYLANHSVEASDLPSLVGNVCRALRENSVLNLNLANDFELGFNTAQAAPPHNADDQIISPAASTSVHSDHLICLEDGRSMRSLKRHLREAHGLTPEQYRQKWGLPLDYPLVAPDLADRRSRLAFESGFGGRRHGQQDHETRAKELRPIVTEGRSKARSRKNSTQAGA